MNEGENMNFLRRLFCRHEYKHHRNIYGDEIMQWGWKRSLWRCEKCGRIEARADLENERGSDTKPPVPPL